MDEMAEDFAAMKAHTEDSSFMSEQNTPEQVRQRLRDARKFLRLRQQAVADYLGMKRQSYAAIENGTRSLMALEMVHLCNLYRITPNELLGFSNQA